MQSSSQKYVSLVLNRVTVFIAEHSVVITGGFWINDSGPYSQSTCQGQHLIHCETFTVFITEYSVVIANDFLINDTHSPLVTVNS